MEKSKTFRPIPGLSRVDEEQQLTEILQVAQENLGRTEQRIHQLSDELYDLMETYGPKDKEALSLLHNTQSQLRENQRDLIRCRKARKKPYFGRIDFKDSKLPQEESYYVGRVGISKSGSDPIVIDWRAPLASVYYENVMGSCRYTVKNEGICEIDLKRKRTYEIEHDHLIDFFDSDVVANDELLTKYLAKSKKAVLGEIIATIQKEQNDIIRKSPKTNLIVQGVAGSGKTTVAMHRISYILYNYEDDFRPEDFYIIGSNRILLNYITSVLPDLDVYGVSQMTMEQLFVRLLYEDWDSAQYHIVPLDQSNLQFIMKGSYAWFHDLERFCEEYECSVIPRQDVSIEKNGKVLLEKEVISDSIRNYPAMSMQSKINMLNAMLLSRLENELSGKYVSYTPEEKKELHRNYRWYFGKDVWKGSIFDLYRGFLLEQKKKGKEIPWTEDSFDVYDLAALAYLYKRIKETDGIREASHVIIDEAQDFGMMAYGALVYCLRGCTYTIMGDVSQNIHFGYGLNDWKNLQELVLTGTFDSFNLLKKSYRNTVEISHFATEILRHGNFSIYPVEPIIRHGNPVMIKKCVDEADMLLETAELIKQWQGQGYETIAVICRDEEEAGNVSCRLGEMMTLSDCNPETAEFGNGIIVLPVEYTKGLEFDAVLLYHPSEEHYPAQDQYVKLLYVAATRALHELAVVHQGDLTDLIGKPAAEEKRMQSLENVMRKTPVQYRKTEITVREQQLLDVEQGNKEKAMRNYMGPKPIVVPKTLEKTQVLEVKKSQADRQLMEERKMHRFGTAPENHLLRPSGHSRIDNSVRILKKTRTYLDIISNYGILRLTPLENEIIRVQFQKGQLSTFDTGAWNYEPQSAVRWTAKEGKNLAEVSTEKIIIRIEKKTGALQFMDKNRKFLLEEKAELPRQIENLPAPRTWVYFNWPQKEKISAKGILDDSLERMNQKARYISIDGKKLRMPLLISENGYGIGIAAENNVICCDIPMYGPYVYTEKKEQIDYYFLYGGDYEHTLQLYKIIDI